MKLFDQNFKDIMFSQIILISVGVVSGTFLAIYSDKILMIPGMLILLPGFLEMRGNISGSMSSRLSSGLFLGVINPRRERTKIVKGNFIASFSLAVFISLVLGLIAFAFDYVIFGVTVPEIIFLPLIAGMIANAIEIPLTMVTTFYLFRKGHDPNNIMAPFVSTTGDVISILSLLAAVIII